MFEKHRTAIFSLMRTVSFVQYKGGSGKTTLAALLCRVLSAGGYRVLAIDLDRYQNHLSALLGGSKSPEPFGRTASMAYASGVLSHLIQRTSHGLLDCISLCGTLCDQNTRDELHLRKRIAFFNFRAQYDYVLIDTPPGFGSVHNLAIHASDDIILPTDLSPISISAIERFCVDLDKRPGLSALRCSIVRNCVKLSSDAMPQVLNCLREKTKARVALHSLTADEGIRSITSGRGDFLTQTLPPRIVSQLVHIAVDVLRADRIRLKKADSDLREPECAEHQEGLSAASALVFDGLLDTPPTMTLATDVSIPAS
jgi:cellulose biosynthesis protein BcsQ